MSIVPSIPEKLYHVENQTKNQRGGHWLSQSSRTYQILSPCPFCSMTIGHPIGSRPFRSMTMIIIGPPIAEIQFDLENSRSKIKVECTQISAASSWLISFVFHIRASYRLPSPSSHDHNDNRASHSRDTTWPWKFKVKDQGQRYPSQRSIQLTHFLVVSHQLDQPFLRYGKQNVRLGKTDENFSKKKIVKKCPTEFL